MEQPPRDRRRERRDATINEILAEAWTLVREEGLAGLSLRELAARVGMKAPSLYSYFDSKFAIYDALFAQGMRVFLEADARLEFTGDPQRDIAATIRWFVEFGVADPARYQLIFQRTIPGFAPSPATFALAVEGLERQRRRLAALGFTEPWHLDLLTAVSSGLADQQIANDPGGDRWLRLVDDAVAMFVAHAAAPSKPRKARRPPVS